MSKANAKTPPSMKPTPSDWEDFAQEVRELGRIACEDDPMDLQEYLNWLRRTGSFFTRFRTLTNRARTDMIRRMARKAEKHRDLSNQL